MERPRNEYPIIQLLPNMLTVTAICAGLTAIRYGVHGNYVLAVQLILAACVLDGLDGRLARALNSDSSLGAELDSLADFLNFGVAPPLVLYFWALQDVRRFGWLAVLVFAVCCVVRLARFNVSARAEETEKSSDFFVGVPAPAGAMLVMMPMFVSFAFAAPPVLPGVWLSLYIGLVGLLLISRIPTWSFKSTKVSRENVKYFLVGFALVGAAVLTFAWITLLVLCFAYVGAVIWALIARR